jgi:hypothetical protein
MDGYADAAATYQGRPGSLAPRVARSQFPRQFSSIYPHRPFCAARQSPSRPTRSLTRLGPYALDDFRTKARKPSKRLGQRDLWRLSTRSPLFDCRSSQLRSAHSPRRLATQSRPEIVRELTSNTQRVHNIQWVTRKRRASQAMRPEQGMGLSCQQSTQRLRNRRRAGWRRFLRQSMSCKEVR